RTTFYRCATPPGQSLERDWRKRLKKSHLGIGVGLAMLAAAVWVAYRWRTSGFAWDKFKGSLYNLDWRWMSAALALILITYFGRALRWEVMLRPLRQGILNPAGLAVLSQRATILPEGLAVPSQKATILPEGLAVPSQKA